MLGNMKINFFSLRFRIIGLGSVLLTLAFASAQAGPQLSAVGPRPPGMVQGVSGGYLEVFSRTEQTQWGEGTYYYPHTSYRILNGAGQTVQWVDNHNSTIDEDPQKVELAPGTYTVKAWSDRDGLVSVPVVIKRAQLTAVHLEKGRASDEEAINPAHAVRTPSGQVVGWRA